MSEIFTGISRLRKPTFRAIKALGRLDATGWGPVFGWRLPVLNAGPCGGSGGGKMNSKRPRSSVMVAKLLSGEKTSARLTGSCVTEFMTTPRMRSGGSVGVALWAASRGGSLKKSVIAKATAVREQRRKTAAFLRVDSSKQSCMCSDFARALYDMF